MRALLPLALLAAACAGGSSTTPKETGETGAPPTDTPPTDTDTDTEPSSPDEDGDGWTVAEGDCDDHDVWVNPGWDEDTNDDIDNDCDGRIDEVFTGLAVFEVDVAVPSATLHTLDTLGDLKTSTPLTEPIVAYSLKDDFEGGGWVANDYVGIWRIAPDGVVTNVVMFEDLKLPKGVGDFGLYGVAAHPDGYYLVSAVNALLKFEVNGSWSVVADWPMDLYGKAPHDVAPIDLATDPLTGTVGMIGVFGGFSTWSAETGYASVKAGEPPYGTPYVWNVESDDSGRFFGLGADAKGATVLFRWDDETGDFVTRAAWPSDSFAPFELSMEGESGDAYATANGGWYRTVWRLYADGTPGSQLFTTEPDNENASFTGIATLWDED